MGALQRRKILNARDRRILNNFAAKQGLKLDQRRLQSVREKIRRSGTRFDFSLCPGAEDAGLLSNCPSGARVLGIRPTTLTRMGEVRTPLSTILNLADLGRKTSSVVALDTDFAATFRQ